MRVGKKIEKKEEMTSWYNIVHNMMYNGKEEKKHIKICVGKVKLFFLISFIKYYYFMWDIFEPNPSLKLVIIV